MKELIIAIINTIILFTLIILGAIIPGVTGFILLGIGLMYSLILTIITEYKIAKIYKEEE